MQHADITSSVVRMNLCDCVCTQCVYMSYIHCIYCMHVCGVCMLNSTFARIINAIKAHFSRRTDSLAPIQIYIFYSSTNMIRCYPTYQDFQKVLNIEVDDEFYFIQVSGEKNVQNAHAV